jgi:hypothetical protein
MQAPRHPEPLPKKKKLQFTRINAIEAVAAGIEHALHNPT